MMYQTKPGARARRCLLSAFVFAGACALAGYAQKPAERPAEKPAAAEERFDLQVRNDFFAGFTGDTEAFERAMKRCEDMLAGDPKHAEALVWHGGGLVFRSRELFQKSDVQAGIELWTRGLSEMARAVELGPDNVGVRIPRGALLLQVSRFVPAEQRPGLLTTALGDYERTYELQKEYFDRLSAHARGELLFGLAEGWHRHGNAEKAAVYFEKLAKVGKASGYMDEATTYLETHTLPEKNYTCRGCHVPTKA